MMFFAAIVSRNTSVRCNKCLIHVQATGYKKNSKIFLLLAIVIVQFLSWKQASAQLTYKYLAVQYDSPWVCGKLKLIPVKFKDTSVGNAGIEKKSIISFEQAMKEGKITVKETSLPGGADVGLLEIKNHSHKNVLIQSGEMITGGMQDRAFAETTIIPPNETKNNVPVFCIEKGRWENKQRTFRYAGEADQQLRKQMNVTKRQNKIWKEIDRQLDQKGIHNKTSTYLDLFKDADFVDTACLHFFQRKIMDSDSTCAGFIGITGKRIISCEIFGSNDLCVASFDALLKSYNRSVTMSDDVPSVPDNDVKVFLDKFLETEDEQQKYLSKHGIIFSYQGKIIHIVAYDN